ncbi:MAG TPA: TlyA family RNA methyltransferase [Oscillospiraceae bacterium]|nr:TlyA family RNA methyltransferase [Oscillospiraceae bacterium]
MVNEVRLDIALVQNGVVRSRQRAKELIEEGKILLNGSTCKKAAVLVSPDSKIEVEGEKLKYVSRGGLKLEKALKSFNLSVEGKVCIDYGASTGGFTDCLLQAGARRVYAIDVGTQQLNEKLQKDERVISLEQTNARILTRSHIPELADFSCVDLSFISLQLVLPTIKDFLVQDGECVVLIKPQFEAGRENIGKNGIVKSPKIHKQVLHATSSFAYSIMMPVKAVAFSPVKGSKGNIEYLFYMQNGGKFDGRINKKLDEVVDEAFSELKGR